MEDITSPYNKKNKTFKFMKLFKTYNVLQLF